MKLYFLRHAEALDGKDDAGRPLSPHGKKEARKVGRFLKGAGIEFDDAGGTFRSSWIPAGVCTVLAQSQDPKTNRATYAVQRLNVTSDLTGVHLALLPSGTIPLNIRLEATRPDSQGNGGTHYFFSDGRGQTRSDQSMFARVTLIPQERAFMNGQEQYSESIADDDPTPANKITVADWLSAVNVSFPSKVAKSSCNTMSIGWLDPPGATVKLCSNRLTDPDRADCT